MTTKIIKQWALITLFVMNVTTYCRHFPLDSEIRGTYYRHRLHVPYRCCYFTIYKYAGHNLHCLRFRVSAFCYVILT
jgi:hypothetical protein